MGNGRKVLLVGATGHLGGKVVQALLARNMPVRAMVREGTDASRLMAQGVEVIRGDLRDRSLVGCCTRRRKRPCYDGNRLLEADGGCRHQ